MERSDGFRVRRAVVDDADAIGEAHGSSWVTAYAHIFDSSFLASAAQSRRIGWRSSISHVLAPPSVLLVAEVHGEVRAFAHAIASPEAAHDAEVRAFFAHPDVWGRGLAAVLMDDLCDALLEDGYQDVSLWTPRDAHRARAFYGKAGFATTGNSRLDQVADWTTGARVLVAEVEYGKLLDSEDA